MTKISNSPKRSSRQIGSVVSRRLPALCERRHPRRPYKVDCGAGVHKAPAVTELEILEFPLMNNPS